MRLVWLTLAWLGGMVAAASLPRGLLAPWLILAACGVLLRLPRLRPQVGASGVLLIFVALGGLRMALTPTASELRAWNGRGGMTLHGTVHGSPTVRDGSVSVVVDVAEVERGGAVQTVSGRALVEAPTGTVAYPGDSIAATGLLQRPPDGDRFSYADYLARRGITSQLTQAFVRVTPATGATTPERVLAQLRAGAQARIATHLPEPYAALLSGILLGDESRISPDIEAAYAATGTAHILAISGFNMVVIATAVSAALRRLGLSAGRTAVLSIMIIGGYTAFVGGSPAVTRAALMSGVLVLAPVVRRRAYVPASVALTVLLMSLHDPQVLWDIGFQYSVAATLGLSVFADPIQRAFERVVARVLRGHVLAVVVALIGAPLAATLAAQITTTPISVLHFGALSLVVLPVNLLVLPVQPSILFAGGLAVVASALFAPLGTILFWLAMLPLAWTTSVVRTFAALPFAQVDASLQPELAALILLALGGVGVLEAVNPGWHTRARRQVARRAIVFASSAASITVLALGGAVALARPDGQLHVHFLDVGHSNAVLIQTPAGAQVLVDGGRMPSRLLTALGDRMPFNDHTIEVLILTQPDPNEYAALTDVAARYAVGLVISNEQPNLDPAWVALHEQIGDATQRGVRAGERIALGDGVVLEVLHPTAPPEVGDAMDDGALLLRVRYGEASILLTGDLSREAQAGLVASGGVPAAYVLQAPQHATARSLDADFLAAVAPSAIIVQSAADNRRGDPNADTLALFGSVPLFRTDEAGALHVWTDGETMWVNGERQTSVP